MGVSVSKEDLSNRVKGLLNRNDVKDVVLVPPLFERDFRGRSRMTRSAYDWMFCKPGLKWLFNDYIKQDQIYTLWRLRPAEDPRFTVHSRIAAKQLFGDQLHGVGRVALRFQPQISEPLTFVDLKTGTQSGPVLRTCVFLLDKGIGFWTSTPVQSAEQSSVGIRYTSPFVSAGMISQPLRQEIEQLWLVGKNGPLTGGVQLDLRNRPEPKNPEELGRVFQQSASYALAYSPDTSTGMRKMRQTQSSGSGFRAQSRYFEQETIRRAILGRSHFSTAIELKEQTQMTVSLLYHMAVQRNCRNPLEKSSVVGVTNYIDMGLLVTGDLTESVNGADSNLAKKKSSISLAGAWQVNKNWLLKARLGSESASCAAAFKAWWQPSMLFALAATYDYADRLPKFGISYALENYGNIRYERSGERLRYGKALVQRHVAFPEDIANKQGEGLLIGETSEHVPESRINKVQKEDLNNPEILGQTQAASAAYL